MQYLNSSKTVNTTFSVQFTEWMTLTVTYAKQQHQIAVRNITSVTKCVLSNSSIYERRQDITTSVVSIMKQIETQ
jgi:hypothetical protein